ncbi:MAG: Chromate transporter [Tardiphaga sp.]|uniref:hypothetical protein n=1 Tax=Tardiphaga sp. TaxID=1926292 RepID=UPI002609D6DF|nr:hypothetical protein [Tardiphaga sp.]MDB5503705.1 Chromate transporter [Tardiphaga sp.]
MPVAGKLLALGFGCAALFYSSLHPWSGTIGGLLYWLIGWALPTVAVIGVAGAAAWLLPIGTMPRLLIAAVLSIPLGLNTSLQGIGETLSYKPNVYTEIRQRVLWRDAASYRSISVKKQPWAAIMARPAGPQVQVAGDEGCGCLYFVDRKDTFYSDLMIDRLYQVIGRRGTVVDYAALKDPTEESRDVHINLAFFETDKGYRAIVELFDQGRKIAEFAQDNIPRRAIGNAIGLGRERIDANFWPNATDLLLHDNLWNAALNAFAPGRFPEQAFREFIEASIASTPRP